MPVPAVPVAAAAMPAALVAALAERLPGNDDRDRPLMQLATVDSSGGPDVRSVLLTAWDADGFLFNTDTASRKTAQLAAHGAAALCLVLPTGQVVVRGASAAQTPEEERAAYAARSPYLRQLAWVNTPLVAAAPQDERRRVWDDFSATNDVAALEPSATWTGYRVRPTSVTVWTADPLGPSHRVEHSLTADGTWTVTHLPG